MASDHLEECIALMGQCEEFGGGSWTKSPPTEPGIYRVADIHGVESLTPIELKIVNGELVCFRDGNFLSAAKVHRGWWWSVRNPTLPRP